MTDEQTPEKFIRITNDNGIRYHCTVKLPNNQLIKFHSPTWQELLNKLGHLLIALTPDIERATYTVAI